MNRMDKVYEALNKYGKVKGITAGDLAKILNISRANCCSDLNRLFEERRVEKKGSKPVYYFPLEQTSKEENPFAVFIRNNPSLSKCGELAKAAVLYPPNGMNMLLLGETGVGKNMFAEMIYDFACSLGRILTPDSFVTFNCADYANNPQLLLSQLFGVVKGAYTGADQDKEGLFEAAEGGILFLDEVHRLPAEGQEMLFTYMDRGVFRRLGETTSERNANIMLICATTENPNSTLLQTFLRRLPVVIQIPSLTERSMEERQYLIFLFFSREAKHLKKTIHVSVNSLRALLGYHSPGNIGQLAGDIRLLCAKAYADLVSGNAKGIHISSFSLPPHIRNGFLNERSRRDLWNRFDTNSKRYISFDSDGTLPSFESEHSATIYELMERQTSDMKRVGISDDDIHAEISNLLERYYQHLGKENQDGAALERLVGSEIKFTTDKLLEKAKQITKYDFSSKVQFALAMHIFNTLKRVKEGKPIKYPDYAQMEKKYKKEWQAAVECLAILQNDFSIPLPLDEAAFLTLFFSPDTFSKLKQHPVQVIVIAHGTGTASGMADAANHLLGLDSIVGFDMSMSESPNQVYKKIKKFLETHDERKEVLFLVDMGSLTGFAQSLELELPIKTKTISCISTPHVIEAGRKAALGDPLNEIYETVNLIRSEFDPVERKEEGKNHSSKLFVVAVCTTGKGSAQMLLQRMEKKLDLHSCFCSIVSLSITDRKEFECKIEELKKEGKIVAVVGAFQTELNVPHLSISSVLTEEGTIALQKRLNWESLRFRLVDTISDLLDQLDAAAAIEAAHDMIGKLVLDLDADLSEEMLVGILSHILFMLNRLKKGEHAPVYPNKEVLYQKYPRVVKQVEQASRLLGHRFGVSILEDEVYYIAAFFTKERISQTPITW